MTMPDGERERMIEAVVRVAERSLYACAEPVSDALMPASIDGGWHVASLQFRGPFSGRVSMAVPTHLSRQLCAAFLGDDVEDEAAVRDLIGEFVNMACGSWLTSCAQHQCFDLARPEVISSGVAPRCDLAFVINDMPVVLTMEMTGAAS